MYEHLKTYCKEGKVRIDHRGNLNSTHHGEWTTPGGWNYDLIYKPDTTDNEIIELVRWIAERVSKITLKHFPEDAERMKQIPEKYRLSPESLFTLLIINFTCENMKYHEDGRDDGPCVVVPLGEYEGGELGFSELNTATRLLVGDVAIFRSAEYYHAAMKYVGNRMSLVFCIKKRTLENALKIMDDANKGIDSYAKALERKRKNKKQKTDRHNM